MEEKIDLNEILEKGQKIREELLIEEKGLKVETKRATYLLIKSDGLKLHHAGYFISLGEELRFGQLFFAFSKVKTINNEGDEIEEEKILPFLFEVVYKNGNISSSEIRPLNEVDYIDLGETVAQIEKKTISHASLPTQIPLEVIEKIHTKKNTPSNPEDELRKVYVKLKEKLKTHIDQPEDVLDVALCWTLATYWSEVFGIMPLLELIGVSGSGKTKFGTALTFIAKKGLGIADPTDANLSRIIDGLKPTLLVDDWDEVMRKRKEIAQSILKHTYKSTVMIPRLTQFGKKFFIDLFSPYAPVIITTTEPITEPQLSRRIIELECKKSEKRFPNISNYVNYFLMTFKEERTILYELMFILIPKVFHIFESLDVDLPQPYAELWLPILTVAKILGVDVYSKVYEYAKSIIEEKQLEVYADERLALQAIDLLFKERVSIEGEKVELLEFTSSDVREKIKKILEDEQEFDEKLFEKQFTPRKIANVLKRLGIKSCKRTNKKRMRAITRKEFFDILNKLNLRDFVESDGSDGSDGTSTCVDGFATENTYQNAIKTSNFEAKENLTHADIPSLPSLPSPLFLRLENGYYSRCSYCGEMRVLEWMDHEGNCLCSKCKAEAEG
ncbi:MAG: hypothetical protein QW051_03680 [Candidatus Aenigmatarchaeota archaeon]